MENNKQNTVLLIIIAIATLLVAVVGATFAYFTANNPNGSTAQVNTRSGKMLINFADGTDTIAANLKANIEPSNKYIVNKTFTITGDNITSSKLNNTDTGVPSLVMPFIVSLDYTTNFINSELHVLIKQTSGASEFIQNVSYAGTLLSESTTAPTTLKGIAGLQDYYDYTVGDGTRDSRQTSGSKELVYGEFKDTTDAGTNNKITFNLIMIFPDTGASQDYNKMARFDGVLKVTTTEKGLPRTTVQP